MTENTTTAAPAATQPEALRQVFIEAMEWGRYFWSPNINRLEETLRVVSEGFADKAAAMMAAAPAAPEAEPAVLPVAAKTHGAWDGLELLDELPDGTELYAHPPGSQADAEAAKHNWNIIQYFDHWLLEQGALLCNRSEEADGKMAAALNWIDSVKALVAAPQAPAAAVAPADPWRNAVLNLIDDCPGLSMEQDRWLTRRVKELDFPSAAAPAAAPTQEADGWMPIETAPRDGTEIDLFNRDGHREAGAFWGLPPHECGEMGRYCDSEWHGYEPGWVTDFWGEPQPDSHFTHWRRPPAPPAARARQEGAQHER